MGLDMYLRAERYVGGYSKADEEYTKLVSLFDAAEIVAAETPSAYVKFTVAYWRKANHIHKWFVDNVQNGEDECRPHDVSRGQLSDLLRLCAKLLAERTRSVEDARELAERELPPQAGFFFGATVVDDWYWQDVTETVSQLDRALAASDDWGFEYQSSW